MNEEWNIEDSDKIYAISKWGEGFFDIDSNGNMIIRPNKDSHSIPIIEVIKEMKSQNISLPAVIRFHDILRHKVKYINKVFRDTIDEADYCGKYFGVFPVKVNQMREVVEEIVDAGQAYDFGLEAGSKSELLAVLAYNQNPNSLTILNGYKDENYLRLALMGTQLNRKFIIAIEKFSELETLISLSRELGIRPIIGLRTKMMVKSVGKWAKSSGENAKFGLSTSEILNAVELLRENDLLSSLKLLHFHIGSQICDIRILKEAIHEAGRTYVGLVKLGVPLEYFDAGGGLGVDYDGSKTQTDSSINYSIKEYVADIVWGLKQICDLTGVNHPHIVTESGRALTAHHSCLITNVLGEVSANSNRYQTKKLTGEHIIVENMRTIKDDLNPENIQQSYNEAIAIKTDTLQAFRLGVLSLEEKAKAETLYWQIIQQIYDYSRKREEIPEELQHLNKDLSSQYLCNFSIFQSAADTWAIDQVLPITPITRLNERPTKNCAIADITCDSDGKIDKFISQTDTDDTLLLHDLVEGEDYYIGLFLTGAYQDVMGDMHNLFGRLNEVHIYSDPSDSQGFYIEEFVQGNSASHVLSTMQYHPENMVHSLKKMVNKEVLKGQIPPRRGVKIIDFYENCLKDYTYLN